MEVKNATNLKIKSKQKWLYIYPGAKESTMKITITDDSIFERVELPECKVTEVSRKQLYAGRHNVNIKFYWNSHGKREPWENEHGHKQTNYRNAQVTIEEVITEQLFEGDAVPFSFTTWQMVVVTAKGTFKHSIASYKAYSNGGMLYAKEDIGWG